MTVRMPGLPRVSSRKGSPLGGYLDLADLLEPVLRAADADDAELCRAITLVAEAMAVLGVTIAGPTGGPLPGVSDEQAVLHLLRRYRQRLARRDRLEDALVLRDLARRIEVLRLPGAKRGRGR